MSAIPDWATAHGGSLFTARIRSQPSDFVVTEQLDLDPSGAGEHALLWVEKTGNNTQWVADQLARHAGVSARDVGFAGMKDRHAITRQWFSVRCAADVDWEACDVQGVRVLESHRHQRKLKRGTHRGNAFRIALRGAALLEREDRIVARLQTIAAAGVPNYFGEQRFGHDGRNLDLCRRVFGGQRLSRAKRSIALSAARALIFNSILDARVRAGSWNSIMPGELANLDGSGSVFAVSDIDAELAERCLQQDIHPTASLWGKAAPASGGAVAKLESSIAAELGDYANGLVTAGTKVSSRALRVRVTALRWQIENEVVWLEFELRKGSFATAVLRELSRSGAA